MPENITNDGQITHTKYYGIKKAPETVLLHLGRFQGMWGEEKSHKKIKIPYEIYLKTHKQNKEGTLEEKSRKIKYQLKSAILHLGPSAQSGHYVAYSFHGNKKNKKILQYDDHRITEIKKPLDNLYQNGYILAYEKNGL